MTEKVLNKPMYADEIVKIFRSGLPKDELIEKISDYHTSLTTMQNKMYE